MHLYIQIGLNSANRSNISNQSQEAIEMSNKKPLSLLELSLNASKNNDKFTANVLGIVVDVTRPIYREKQKNYITEIKIIDQTVNQQNIYSVMIKCCSIYLFSKNEEDLELVHGIGDLVYLSQFNFTIWNEIKLQTRYKGTIEGFYHLQIEGQNEKHISLGNYLTINFRNDFFTEEIIEKAIALRNWSNLNLHKVFKPNLGISLINNYSVLVEPFNMILQIHQSCEEEGKDSTLISIEDLEKKEIQLNQEVTNLKMENNQSFPKIEYENQKIEPKVVLWLKDENHNIYFINISKRLFNSLHNHKNFSMEVNSRRCVYIRGIKNIGNFYEIFLSATGNILVFGESDQKEKGMVMNYCAIHRFNEKLILKKNKKYMLTEICHTMMKATPILELMELEGTWCLNIERYRLSSKKEDISILDYYLVEAVAISFQGELKIFHTEYQMIIHEAFLEDLSVEERKECAEEKKIIYAYEGHITLIDRSSQFKENLLKAYFFSYDRKGTFFQDDLLTQLNIQLASGTGDKLEFAKIQKYLNQKIQHVVQKSTFSNTASLLLEPIKSDLLIFRVVNTKLK